MLTAIIGNIGTGKTLLLVLIAKLANIHNKKIISNFYLSFKHEKLNIDKFLNQEYSDCIILLDEAYVYLESRISMSLQNRLSSYIVFQARKKNVDIYLTAQLLKTIDIRFRDMLNIIVYSKLQENSFNYDFYNFTSNKFNSKSLTFENASKFYKYYNTNEIIQDNRMLHEIESTSNRKKVLEKFAKTIKKYYKTKTKITLDDIKLYFYENKINVSNDFSKFVHKKVKELV